MKFALFILIMPLSIYSMDKDNTNFEYDEKRSFDFPLKDHFIYSDCEKLKNASQETKNWALNSIFSSRTHYSIRRHHIANLVRMGADSNSKSCHPPSLVFNDYHLLKLLIDHGLNIKSNFDGCNQPIFYAKAKLTAELLLSNGVDAHSKNSYRQNLLFAAVTPEASAELVAFYKEKGVSPFESCDRGYLPLHHFAYVVHNHTDPITKASLLLDGLTSQEIIAMISHEDGTGRTVINILEKHKNDGNSKELLDYLQTTLESAHTTQKNLVTTFCQQLISLATARKKYKEKVLKLQTNK